MIRFILCAIALLIYLILWIPLILILLLLRKKNRKLSEKISFFWAGGFLRIILFLAGCKLTVRGKENIPVHTPVLYVSNHRSIFDIVAAVTVLPENAVFMAKMMLSRYPLFAQWLTLLGVLFLDHNDLKQEFKSILRAIELVKTGTSVWICPEGTRNKSEDPLNLLEFKEGSLKIAEKAGCPVIPVAITGTREIFERQFPALKPGHITLEFGKPFLIKDLPEENRKGAGAYSRSLIGDMLKEENRIRNEQAGTEK